MKNYILLLGVAGVALGSYAAYAGNTATMQVSATIAHDASLSWVEDISIGTITIDPSQKSGSFICGFDGGIALAGDIEMKEGGVISVSGGHPGRIRANLPDLNGPMNNITITPSPLVVDGLSIDSFYLVYTDESNIYQVMPDGVSYSSLPQAKNYSGTITITYHE
ncbi:MAG: hypothetical protein IJ689_00475 [Alphaproteobacteria bacterium]|nr:hypothetical protein [Alphaproteobacteria bacterium]